IHRAADGRNGIRWPCGRGDRTRRLPDAPPSPRSPDEHHHRDRRYVHPAAEYGSTGMGLRADRLSEAVRDGVLFNRAGPSCAAACMDHCSWHSRHGVVAALPCLHAHRPRHAGGRPEPGNGSADGHQSHAHHSLHLWDRRRAWWWRRGAARIAFLRILQHGLPPSDEGLRGCDAWRARQHWRRDGWRHPFGLIETFAAISISTSYKDAVGMILLILILLAWPEGLVGLIRQRR